MKCSMSGPTLYLFGENTKTWHKVYRMIGGGHTIMSLNHCSVGSYASFISTCLQPSCYCICSGKTESFTPAPSTAKRKEGKRERRQSATLGMGWAIITSFLFLFTVCMTSLATMDGRTPWLICLAMTVEEKKHSVVNIKTQNASKFLVLIKPSFSYACVNMWKKHFTTHRGQGGCRSLSQQGLGGRQGYRRSGVGN